MAKTTEKTLERTYNVPLRKEFMKVPRWKKTEKAVIALRKFLSKHMKSDNVKLGKEVNEQLWKHGIRNPPHHIKVNVTKDSEGVVKAELFGAKEKAPKKEKKASAKEVREEKKTEAKKESEKKEEKEELEEAPKIEVKGKEVKKEA